MPITIKSESTDVGLKATAIIVVVLAIILILIVLYLYFVLPAIQRRNAIPAKVACTVAPNPPANFSGAASGNTVTLTWQATTNTDSYNVYVSTKPVFDKSTADRVIPSTTNSATVINLVPVTYYFTVTSVNSCGESPFSTEISVTVTTWPSRIQICKQDNPLLCLALPEVTNQNATVTLSCQGGACILDYPNQQHIAKNPNDAFCLNTTVFGNPTIEFPVNSQPCNSMTTGQNWVIDLNTGRIRSPTQNLCLGADDTAETFAYNTTCSAIGNPQDPKYLWVVQPV